ncbi:MAG: hypothetical protein Q4C96_02250 [Planctomycetia bacterium]|nr:hypothetical protein [Planctomycetia bacterium]
MDYMRKGKFRLWIPGIGILCLMFLLAPAHGQSEKKSIIMGAVPQVTGEKDVKVVPEQKIESVPFTSVPCESCSRGEFVGDISVSCECQAGRYAQKEHISLRKNRANMANFNCRVNGSYKYPVPKQYTYFWPGIFSQKRMTDYVSPYQGYELESPQKVFGTK